MPFDIAGARKAGYSDDEIADFLSSQGGEFDFAGARAAGYSSSEIIDFVGSAEKPQGRTWGEAVSDTSVQLGEGVNTILGAVPNLVAPEGETAAFFNRNAEYWRDKQSDVLKSKIASADQAITAAGEDGVISQISEAASQYFTDPALAARFITTNLPSMIPGIGAAKLAQAAALAKGATAARAAMVATTAAGATNAALNAGGARGEAFEDIKNTLMQQGVPEDQAIDQALKDSRVVAAIGGLTGFISGKTGLEKSIAGGVTKGGIRAGVGSAVTELVGEQLEEVTPKLATNVQASQYDNRSIGKDVGRTIVETAIGSGPGAVIAGGMSSAATQDAKAGGEISNVDQPVSETPQVLALENKPDPLISFPDGSVGRQSDVDNFIASLPENQRIEARARLFGLGSQPVETATIQDIGAAQSVDEAIAAAESVVSAPTEIEQSLKNEQIDAAWRAYISDVEGQRQRDFEAAEQARREADIPKMEAQLADQKVEQADILTKAQGFDVAEPTAIQLAMEAARAKLEAKRKLAKVEKTQESDGLTIPVDSRTTNATAMPNSQAVTPETRVVDTPVMRQPTAELVEETTPTAQQSMVATIADQEQGATPKPPGLDKLRANIARLEAQAAARKANAPAIPEAAPASLQEVRKNWKSSGIVHSISEGNGTISLSQIIVPNSKRGEGVGTAAMQSLIDYADKTGQRIVLPKATQLNEFFKRFGFVADNGASGAIYRNPASQTVAAPMRPEAATQEDQDALQNEQVSSTLEQDLSVDPELEAYADELEAWANENTAVSLIDEAIGGNLITDEEIDERFTETGSVRGEAEKDSAGQEASRAEGSVEAAEEKAAEDEVKPNQGDDPEIVLLHSGLSPIEAIKNIAKKVDEATQTKIPEWLSQMPKETQDAARKAGIYVEKKPLTDRLTELRNSAVKRAQQGIFDQFAPLKELGEREYVLARLTRSSDAPLEALLMYGKPFLNDAGAVDVKMEKGGLISSLQQLQGEHDRFFAWIAGNRASKLKAQGRENLFTDTDITALKDLNQGKMPDGKSRAMLYLKVLNDFNAYSKSVLDIAEKAGIINGQDRAIWESDFYVPFYRVMEDQEFKGPKKVSGMVNQYAFKKLKGGTDNLNDLMQNTLRNWSHLLSASLKNQASAAAISTAEKAGIAMRVPVKQKGSVTILEEGREKHYVIDDPFIMDAITSLEWAGWNNPAMKAMTKAKHYLTLGVTISPTFKIRNLIRDQLAAVGQNPVSYNVLKNLADGWKGTDKESEQYAKMLTGGGLMRFGTFLEDDRAEHMKRLINRGVDSATILDSELKATSMLKSAWDRWQEVGDRSENITRAAIYKQRYEQMIQDGMSDDEAHLMASFAARDSMDFSLQGTWGTIRFLTQLVPFMNARLQGLYKLGREGIAPTGRMLMPQVFGDSKVGDKAKAMRFGAVTGTVALASIALMLAYRDDDDWKNREEWDRDAFWWFKVGDIAYRIPKPFEIGAIGTIAERGLETLLNGMNKESRDLFAKRLSAMLSDTFAMNPVPQLVKPAIDLYANTDSFTGRPIETPGMERLSKGERIGQNTSATAQALGKLTAKAGLSPAQVDHLVKGYLSWLGTHAVMTVDFAVRPLMGLPSTPAWRFPDDYLTIGDFAKSLPADQSKYITKFYEQSQEVQRAMADIRYYQSLGNTEKARELEWENKDKIKLYDLYANAGEQVSGINKQIIRVKASKKSAEEKRDQIDRLTQTKIRLTKIIEETRERLQQQKREQQQ